MNIDRSEEGIITRSDREKERKLHDRAKLGDDGKLAKWVEDNKAAKGILQLPADILTLSACGCIKTADSNRGHLLTRSDSSNPWRHFKCPKKGNV